MNDTLRVVCLPVLLSLSAFFSASETALFSLNPEDRTKLAESNTRSARCALELLSDPRSLLVVVLFGNLLVNFLLLALTAKLLDRLAENEKAKAVVLWLDTPGGSAVAGEEIYLKLREIGKVGAILRYSV